MTLRGRFQVPSRGAEKEAGSTHSPVGEETSLFLAEQPPLCSAYLSMHRHGAQLAAVELPSVPAVLRMDKRGREKEGGALPAEAPGRTPLPPLDFSAEPSPSLRRYLEHHLATSPLSLVYLAVVGFHVVSTGHHPLALLLTGPRSRRPLLPPKDRWLARLEAVEVLLRARNRGKEEKDAARRLGRCRCVEQAPPIDAVLVEKQEQAGARAAPGEMPAALPPHPQGEMELRAVLAL